MYNNIHQKIKHIRYFISYKTKYYTVFPYPMVGHKDSKGGF